MSFCTLLHITLQLEIFDSTIVLREQLCNTKLVTTSTIHQRLPDTIQLDVQLRH